MFFFYYVLYLFLTVDLSVVFHSYTAQHIMNITQSTCEICKADINTKHHTHRDTHMLACCTRNANVPTHTQTHKTQQQQQQQTDRTCTWGFVTFSLCFIIALHFGFEIARCTRCACLYYSRLAAFRWLARSSCARARARERDSVQRFKGLGSLPFGCRFLCVFRSAETYRTQ